MSVQADTRKLAGCTLSVRNTADDDWITTGEIVSIPASFGAASTKTNVSTAATAFETNLVNLPDPGNATFVLWMDLDDEFQQEMETMMDGQETRAWLLHFSEGTKTECTFDAAVVDTSIGQGSVTGAYPMTLTILIQSELSFDEPAGP